MAYYQLIKDWPQLIKAVLFHICWLVIVLLPWWSHIKRYKYPFYFMNTVMMCFNMAKNLSPLVYRPPQHFSVVTGQHLILHSVLPAIIPQIFHHLSYRTTVKLKKFSLSFKPTYYTYFNLNTYNLAAHPSK